MHRIIGLRWRPGAYQPRKTSEQIAARLLEQGGWRQALSVRGFLLLVTAQAEDFEPTMLGRQGGMVLGVMFERQGETYTRAAPSAREISAWTDSAGQALTATYWGGYLAILVDGARDRILIVRDPMGARPCFVRGETDDGLRIIFTDASDLALIAPLPEPDQNFLALFLAQPRLVTERTGLTGVREVLPGECVALERDHERVSLAWRPPAWSRAGARLATTAAALTLRARVCAAAGAWAGLQRPIVHRLSGGLDSSIALFALAQKRRRGLESPDIQCVIEWPDGLAEGDERQAARATAKRLGAPLTEFCYRAADIDYQRLLAAPLSAKPSITQLSFADPHFGEAFDAGALLSSGQGGDQIFYRSGAVCTIADAVRDRVPAPRLLNIALDAARVSRRSVWPVLAAALEFGVLRSPRAYLRDLLERAARANAPAFARAASEAALADPWVREGLRRGPGEAMRALHMADLQYYHGPSVLTRRFVPSPVLTSQPIAEYCCAIPTYQTFEGGRDRALARMAFAQDLPASAVARRHKGDTTRFFAQVAARNWDFIHAMLSGGELAARGLFDPARLDAKPKRLVQDFSHELVAELWLRRLKACAAQAPCARA